MFCQEVSVQIEWPTLFIVPFVVASGFAYIILPRKVVGYTFEDSFQDVEAVAAAAAFEDKPPEYEKVIEKAPPYESVLMEDAYKTRTMDSARVAHTAVSLDRFAKKDATAQESDPDLPTYEEAARLVCKPVE